MQFPVSDTSPTKVFGLPKNIATEVRAHSILTLPMDPLHCPKFRLLSKPCSVVRGITLKVLGELDGASKKSSFYSRMVLSNCVRSISPCDAHTSFSRSVGVREELCSDPGRSIRHC